MKNNYSEIGKRIAARRKELNLTQEALTNLTDISVNQLSNLENNHSVPTVDTIIKLSDALRVTPDYFLLGVKKDTYGTSVDAIVNKSLLCTERQRKLIYEFISLLIKEKH